MVDIFEGSSVNYNNDSMTARRVETTGKRNNTQLTVKVQKSPPVLASLPSLLYFIFYFFKNRFPLEVRSFVLLFFRSCVFLFSSFSSFSFLSFLFFFSFP